MDDIVYICNSCGERFSLEDGKTLRTEEGKFTACPNCGSDDIEQGRRCGVCKEIHYEWKLKHGVCEDCFADAISSYRSCINYLMPWEREVLEDEYGTIDITEREE